jgi:hypothetical protein
MRVIGLAVVLALSLVLAPQAVYVQEAGKRPRIGVLGGQSPDAPGGPPPIYGLRKGLRELGYVEGQNVAIEWLGTRASGTLR